MFVVGLLIYILGYGALVGVIWLICGKWWAIAILCGILLTVWCEIKNDAKSKSVPPPKMGTTPNNEDLGYCNRANNSFNGFNKWR